MNIWPKPYSTGAWIGRIGRDDNLSETQQPLLEQVGLILGVVEHHHLTKSNIEGREAKFTDEPTVVR